MNALMQQLVTVPAFRDGLIAAVPLQRSAIVEQIQATLANLRDGLAPCYDTVGQTQCRAPVTIAFPLTPFPILPPRSPPWSPRARRFR
jgi:hypothetical protein